MWHILHCRYMGYNLIRLKREKERRNESRTEKKKLIFVAPSLDSVTTTAKTIYRSSSSHHRAIKPSNNISKFYTCFVADGDGGGVVKGIVNVQDEQTWENVEEKWNKMN